MIKQVKVLVILLSFSLLACWKMPKLDFRASNDSEKKKQLVDEGARLVIGLGACGSCHGLQSEPSSPLAGGREFGDVYGPLKAANLTPSTSGIGNWTLADFIKALRDDISKDGSYLSTDFHQGLKWMANKDFEAMFVFLKEQQAVKNEIPKRDIDFWERNTAGFMESRHRVTGYVPKIDTKDGYKYGAYLVDHVADCGRCHNQTGGIFTSKEYLGGGEEITFGNKQAYAPSLLGDPVSGIGSWSSKDILRYLQTGVTYDGTRVDPELCPTNFYRLAKPEDIQAIAAYLKSL